MTRILIYDTTLRDGSQGEGVNFSLQDKLLITSRLDEAGFDYIEGGYPLSNPKDTAYFHAVRDLDLKTARVAAFGMTRRRDIAPERDVGLKALIDAGTPTVTIRSVRVGEERTHFLHVFPDVALALGTAEEERRVESRYQLDAAAEVEDLAADA